MGLTGTHDGTVIALDHERLMPSVCPGVGITHMPGISSASPLISSYAAPSKSIAAGTV
jgi:hypothetical protein